jgi:dTDP-glucose 4,6-dehydratase
LNVSTTNCSNNYGPYQYPEKLIPLSIKCLQRNKKIRLHEQGEPVRNWLHADDTASAIITLVESEIENDIFNISGGFEQKNKVTVQKIIESYHSKDVDWKEYVDINHSRPGQDVRYSVDDSKLRSLGWSPKKSFDKEIVDIVNFYKNNFRW